MLFWDHHSQQALLASLLPHLPAYLPRLLPPENRTRTFYAILKLQLCNATLSFIHLLFVVRNHFLLEEPPDALSEDVVILVEDPAGPNVHQGLGGGGLRSDGGDGLSGLLGLTVLLSGRKTEPTIVA